MMKQKLLLVLALLCLHFAHAEKQNLTQTIRGKVIDKDSGIPLIGANVVIPGTNPQIGTMTNENGEFQFSSLRVGTYQLSVSYLGYEPNMVSDILLRAGKETILTIRLTESLVKVDEVTIKAKKNKGDPINKMALISARSFTVLETSRYAGSFDDPARMASSYAGVMGSPDGNNDIVIRGNSPRGMLWRLEGLEIPNPNHFAEEGASGGAISVLNSKTMDNSDFFTGAFPAEYGNAYSGVFDIRLRNGNNHKREYSFAAGFLGTDVSMEGPFRKGKKSSYLFNYRYSSLALLNQIGIKIAGDAVPTYQNLSFKMSFPTKHMGTFNVFGIGGISMIDEDFSDYKSNFETDMGAVGVSNVLQIDDQSWIKTVIGLTGSKNEWTYKDSISTNQYRLEGVENIYYHDIIAKSTYNRKFSAKHSLKAGVTYSNKHYNLEGKDWNTDEDFLETLVKRKGETGILEGFASWKFRINPEIILVNGLHYSQLFLNNKQTVEPRSSLRWQLSPNQSFSLGFGMHSKIETLTLYLAQDLDENGNIIYPNEQLGFSKALHYIAGYNRQLSENLYLKLEAYYQHLYEVPVEDDPTSNFSSLNFNNGYTNKKLVNKGTGYNYGIEVTLEKYLSHDYYFLITGSWFDSKYKALDNITRNTMYNTNFTSNFLAGKDWKIKNNGVESTLSTSARVIWTGGIHYTPIDLQSSIEHQTTKYNDELAFSEQRPNFLRIDLKLQYRKNKKKTTRVWELDIQNVTNQANVIWEYFDLDKQKIERGTQLGFLPVLSYKIEF